jgi:hypothetical protein
VVAWGCVGVGVGVGGFGGGWDLSDEDLAGSRADLLKEAEVEAGADPEGVGCWRGTGGGERDG